MSDLTEKELLVVKELAQGFTRREIAERQHRSAEVVKKHISHALRKMRARNSVHMIALAKDMGLIAVLLAVFAPVFGVESGNLRKGSATRSFSVRDGRVREDLV